MSPIFGLFSKVAAKCVIMMVLVGKQRPVIHSFRHFIIIIVFNVDVSRQFRGNANINYDGYAK
jgi:hypothetical protein